MQNFGQCPHQHDRQNDPYTKPKKRQTLVIVFLVHYKWWPKYQETDQYHCSSLQWSQVEPRRQKSVGGWGGNNNVASAFYLGWNVTSVPFRHLAVFLFLNRFIFFDTPSRWPQSVDRARKESGGPKSFLGKRCTVEGY